MNCLPVCHFEFHVVVIHCQTRDVPLTLSSRIVVSSSSDELLSAGTEGREAWQEFVQLQPLGSVLRQLLPDLIHLRCHRGRLPQPLDRPLQGFQQGVHLVVKLGTEGELEESIMRRRRRECVEGAGFGFLIAG